MIITPFLVIFIIVVFVLLFLFFNTVDRRKWLNALISLVLAPFVYFYLFYPFVNIVSNYHHQKYFDSEDWINKPTLRYEMIDNTIESDTLIGSSKKEIALLLGKYEWLSWDTAKKEYNQDKWNYGLGIEPGIFNNKSECLEIIFTKGKVFSLRRFQHNITYEQNEEK